jgi:hypothetical protein
MKPSKSFAEIEVKHMQDFESFMFSSSEFSGNIFAFAFENASPDEWLEEQNIVRFAHSCFGFRNRFEMMGELANNLVFHKITCPR